VIIDRLMLTVICHRFVDALGEPQHPYENCDSDYEIAQKMVMDERYMCPMCQEIFPSEMPQPDFVAHVNAHFD